SDLTKALRAFALRSGGKGLVVLISDFLDKNGFEDALRYLVARPLDVYVLHVLADEEVDPDLAGDLKLVDAEDDDAAEVTVNLPLLRRYRENVAAFRSSLEQFCTRRGVSYLFATPSVPFDRLVLDHLRRRGLVR
ncbi:MAG: DUF58 domain-containing protein, partial [Gemmataceae bacterium]